MIHWRLIRVWTVTLAGTVLVGGMLGCDRAGLERTFSADPKAQNWSSNATKNAPLPQDFPPELRYPSATLAGVIVDKPTELADLPKYQTRWTTPDNHSKVIDFYRKLFKEKGWQDIQEATQNADIVLTAKTQELQASISILNGLSPQQASTGAAIAQPTETQFAIAYQRKANPNNPTATSPSSAADTSMVINTAQLPVTLRSYIEEVLQLNVLTPDPATKSGANTTDPNQPISRATFARWLVEANNRLYRDRPSRLIRLADASSTPAFQDVPANHPDFAAIQGLAEAGYIPSALSGDSSQKSFRPTAPLTREVMLIWKVPVDRQQILPTVSNEKVKQIWGFRDANKISAPALSAIASDHGNGDLGNIRRLLGATLLFQPQKAITKAEAIASLWFIGIEGDSLSAKDLLRSEQHSQAQQQTTTPETLQPSPTSPSASPEQAPSGASPQPPG